MDSRSAICCPRICRPVGRAWLSSCVSAARLSECGAAIHFLVFHDYRHCCGAGNACTGRDTDTAEQPTWILARSTATCQHGKKTPSWSACRSPAIVWRGDVWYPVPRMARSALRGARKTFMPPSRSQASGNANQPQLRSEERRVGKEGEGGGERE